MTSVKVHTTIRLDADHGIAIGEVVIRETDDGVQLAVPFPGLARLSREESILVVKAIVRAAGLFKGEVFDA